MSTYVWTDRPDRDGARKAVAQFKALALDDRERVLFTMDTIRDPGPSIDSECRNPDGRRNTIHAQRVDGARGPIEVLYAKDDRTGELIFLGLSTDGEGCRHAVRAAAEAGVP